MQLKPKQKKNYTNENKVPRQKDYKIIELAFSRKGIRLNIIIPSDLRGPKK